MPEQRQPRVKRVRFTPAVLEMRPPKTGRVERRDDLSPLWLRITATGERSFAVRARIKGHTQPVRLTYSERAHISTLAAAREWAIKTDALCRSGIDPRIEQRALAARTNAAQEHVFEKVAARFLATGGRHKKNSQGWRPRTAKEYARAVNKRFIPRWGGREIGYIGRDEIADFLSEIAEEAPVAANRALATLSAMMNWHQRQRGSNFTSPIVRGMAPTEEMPRARILSDDELRLVWRAAGRAGTFGAIVKLLLLTGARRNEVGAMRHSQIGRDAIWELGRDYVKNRRPLLLPLSDDAQAIMAAQPRVDDQDIIFSLSGERQFQCWSKAKADLDKRVSWRLRAIARTQGGATATIPNWRLHDLRRTARSLMARAGVPPEHAERVLNHTIRGVEGTYDRHSYENEKRRALELLANMLRRIVDGQGTTVVPLFRSAA